MALLFDKFCKKVEFCMKKRKPVAIDEKWLNFADEDYRLVFLLWYENTKLYRSICFHAQQYIEKILKGIMEGAGCIPPRIHDINALAKRIAKIGIKCPLSETEILLLSSVYIDTRYPPDAGLVPDGEPIKRDVEIAVKAVEKVRAWIEESK